MLEEDKGVNTHIIHLNTVGALQFIQSLLYQGRQELVNGVKVCTIQIVETATEIKYLH